MRSVPPGGRLRLEGVPAGVYRVELSPSVAVARWGRPDPNRIAIAPGTSARVDCHFDAVGSLRITTENDGASAPWDMPMNVKGVRVGESEEPRPHAVIRLVRPPFVLRVTPAGKYRVRAGYASALEGVAASEVEIVPGRTAVIRATARS